MEIVSNEQAILQHYQMLVDRLDAVPELKPALDIFKVTPDYGVETYISYMALIARMARLTEPDQALISRSQLSIQKQGIGTGSASVIGANDIVNALGARSDLLIETVNQSTDPKSFYYQSAVDDLVTKMEGGHKLKLSGKVPSDNDPESLKVIWGHTLITGDKALFHFVTCHYLGQYFAKTLKAEGLEFADQKDFFVNALTDVVILNRLQSDEPDPIYDLWVTSKQDDGMGWITETRRKSYGL